MKKLIFNYFLMVCCANLSTSWAQSPSHDLNSEKKFLTEDIATFTPPVGWVMADRNQIDLPPLVKVMVVGKAKSGFPPSINLTSAPYQGTLKDYLEIVKMRNQQNHNDWKDLGMIKTKAGRSSLSQIDSKSQWGDVRQMHVIHLQNGTIYILTAAALKSEFSLYYQDFFKAMQSFNVSNDLFAPISKPVAKAELLKEINQVELNWQKYVTQKFPTKTALTLQEKESVFFSDIFQQNIWTPFIEKLYKNFSDLGTEWCKLVQEDVKNKLFELKANEKLIAQPQN